MTRGKRAKTPIGFRVDTFAPEPETGEIRRATTKEREIVTCWECTGAPYRDVDEYGESEWLDGDTGDTLSPVYEPFTCYECEERITRA